MYWLVSLTFLAAASASTLNEASTVVSDAVSNSSSPLFPSEYIQLTDEVIANLTAIDLGEAALFGFDSDNTISSRTSALSCKTYPGDKLWPSKLTWWIFNILLGDRLIKTVPLAAPCYDGWPSVENAALCTTITNNWTDSALQ
jgi:hypothetical protein